MKSDYRVMLGRKSVHADTCFADNFLGTDFGIAQDLTNDLPDNWRAFNAAFAPAFLAAHPDKSRIAAGLACGVLWTVSRGIEKGDVVLCPDGSSSYRVGAVIGGYSYAPGEPLPHRRATGLVRHRDSTQRHGRSPAQLDRLDRHCQWSMAAARPGSA